MGQVHFTHDDLVGLTYSLWPEEGSTFLGYETADGGLYQMTSNGTLTKIFPANENVFTINDANYADHFGMPPGATGACDPYNYYLLDIPANTDIISVETTSALKVFGIQTDTSWNNGHKVTLCGKISYGEPVTLFNGGFTEYLYNYLLHAQSTYDYNNQVFQTFMYWNGIFYYRGY